MPCFADFHPIPGILPRHVGIIPDGGRRWAKSHGCTLHESYNHTQAGLQGFVGFLLDQGVKEISIYLSSIQNFRRETSELEEYILVVESSLKKEITEIAKELNLRVVVAGNREIIAKSVVDAVVSLEQSTLHYSGGRLNLLLAYDPFEEIIRAMTASGGPDQLISHLPVATPVDLVIRSGGAHLLSNFLPLQSGFARLYFFDKLFNDLTIRDISEVLENFSQTDRKFGE